MELIPKNSSVKLVSGISRTMNHLELANQFTDFLKEFFGQQLVSVVLFGSVGRGEQQKTSDIDLIIVLKDLPAGRYIRSSLLEPVFARMDQKGIFVPINCHLKTPLEAKKITVMYFDLPTDAHVLFDTDDFFRKIIDETKSRIKKTGAQKKKWGKFFYWDLKPNAKATDTFPIL